MDSNPGSRRCPGEGNGNLLKYPCLGNLIDRGAWQATVCGVTKNWDLATKPQHIWNGTVLGGPVPEFRDRPNNTGLCEIVLKWDSVIGMIWLILFAILLG